MKYTISKELFEAVMAIPIAYPPKVEDLAKSPNVITYFPVNTTPHMPSRWTGISVSDFFFECKNWAVSKRYILNSKPRTNSSFAICEFDINGKHDYSDEAFSNFRAEDERQAVFDACQWILECS